MTAQGCLQRTNLPLLHYRLEAWGQIHIPNYAQDADLVAGSRRAQGPCKVSRISDNRLTQQKSSNHFTTHEDNVECRQGQERPASLSIPHRISTDCIANRSPEARSPISPSEDHGSRDRTISSAGYLADGRSHAVQAGRAEGCVSSSTQQGTSERVPRDPLTKSRQLAHWLLPSFVRGIDFPQRCCALQMTRSTTSNAKSKSALHSRILKGLCLPK